MDQTKQELDTRIKKDAAYLFELDDISKRILACIATEGPQTIYELDRKHKDLSKGVVFRRIRLKGPQNLWERDFVRLEGRGPSRGSKYWGLALKGFLASLSEVNCEENYMFRILSETCCEYYRFLNALKWNHEQRTEYLAKVRMRLKIDLDAFLSYHVNQGLKLTWITHPLMYYINFWLMPQFRSTEEFGSENVAFLMKATASMEKELTAHFGVPWPTPFVQCWLTWPDLKQLKRAVDLDMLAAFLTEYGTVIKKVRNGSDPPWDYGMRLVGKPIREVNKIIAEYRSE